MSFRRGDENRPQRWILASTRLNGTARIPAPSLRELSSESETEGVSSDGCSGPMVYEPAHMNSEIFERLRATKYTPSASHSLSSSLREGAGNGVRTTHRTARKIQRCGRFSSPLRNSECLGFYHSSECSLKSGGAGDFHRPYERLRRFCLLPCNGKSLDLTESGEWGMIIANI